MNRAELVDSVAKITGQTKSQVHDSMTAILHAITGALKDGERVMLVGFGTFERRNRRERVGVNPQDPRKKIKIEAARIPAFRPGQELKNIVDGKKRLPAPPVAASVGTKKAATKAAPAKKSTTTKKTVAKKAPAKKAPAKKKR